MLKQFVASSGCELSDAIAQLGTDDQEILRAYAFSLGAHWTARVTTQLGITSNNARVTLKRIKNRIAKRIATLGLKDLSRNDLMQAFRECDRVRQPSVEIYTGNRSRDVVTTVRPRIDVSRIIEYAPAELIGREAETRLLNDAWAKVVAGEKSRPRVLTFSALGGEGKTALVAKWAAELAGQDWPGCEAAFAWSFYSQGTRDQTAASSDLLLKEALNFFGDDTDREFAASPAGAFEKGQRLARIIGRRNCLLILDGLEPLQYAPASPTPGELKDHGIAALLKGLAAASQGLCIVTTRYSIPNLKAFWQATAPEVPLLRLSKEAGVHLLHKLGVRNESGSKAEFEKLVEDVKGHALTLTLLGGFLKRAFHGDIRQRDRVKFEKADEKIDGGHAFRTMAAYERWLLRDGGDEGRREVAVLRLMGLFDRPANAGCLAALRREVIPDLTEPLAGLANDDWEFCLSGLESTKLLTVNRDATGALVSLDAHPHLREYFAKHVREQQTDAWRTAHRRLYDHLCTNTPDRPQPTLEDLQPLYQAVAHGCHAGLQQDACKVYDARILRHEVYYSALKLGAFGSDLAAVACFFEPPWSRLSPMLTENWKAWLLNEAAFRLRALGRLPEALELMRRGLESFVAQENWTDAASMASNLSELGQTLGALGRAVLDAEKALTYAARIAGAFRRIAVRVRLGDVLHQAGRQAEAKARFEEAERLQAASEPENQQLPSLRGFLYCDLLLAAPERTAWQTVVGRMNGPANIDREENQHVSGLARTELNESCRGVEQRASQTLEWTKLNNVALHDSAFGHLTWGRAALYRAVLDNADFQMLDSEVSHVEAAVDGLRRAGQQDDLPHGLLTRAWLRLLKGDAGGAQADLDEAWEIAERGPMPLFMADVHLHRARLFFRTQPYPWAHGPENTAGPPRGPKDDLASARELIKKHGYWRRKEELEDAEEASKNW